MDELPQNPTKPPANLPAVQSGANPTQAAPLPASAVPAEMPAAEESALQFEISGRGIDKRMACHKEFERLLVTTSIVYMRRRDSNTLDESDIANAYRHLLASHGKDWLREIFSAFVILIGGVVIAIGAALAIEEKTRTGGVWSLIGGTFVSVLGFLFQHYPFKR